MQTLLHGSGGVGENCRINARFGHGKNMKNCLQGVVTFFNLTTNSGWMKVGNELTQIQFTLDSQREIVAGFNTPEFGEKSPATSPVPQSGVHVVVRIEAGYRLERKSWRKSLRRYKEVTAWNFLTTYKEAEKEIAERPVYRVWVADFYNDDPVTGKPKWVMATGTATQLQSKFPRGYEGDLFAPTTKCLDLETRRWFEIRQTNGEWKLCDDPRPLPVGVVDAPTSRPVNNDGEYLASMGEARDLVLLFS